MTFHPQNFGEEKICFFKNVNIHILQCLKVTKSVSFEQMFLVRKCALSSYWKSECIIIVVPNKLIDCVRLTLLVGNNRSVSISEFRPQILTNYGRSSYEILIELLTRNFLRRKMSTVIDTMNMLLTGYRARSMEGLLAFSFIMRAAAKAILKDDDFFLTL